MTCLTALGYVNTHSLTVTHSLSLKSLTVGVPCQPSMQIQRPSFSKKEQHRRGLQRSIVPHRSRAPTCVYHEFLREYQFTHRCVRYENRAKAFASFPVSGYNYSTGYWRTSWRRLKNGPHLVRRAHRRGGMYLKTKGYLHGLKPLCTEK